MGSPGEIKIHSWPIYQSLRHTHTHVQKLSQERLTKPVLVNQKGSLGVCKSEAEAEKKYETD